MAVYRRKITKIAKYSSTKLYEKLCVQHACICPTYLCICNVVVQYASGLMSPCAELLLCHAFCIIVHLKAVSYWLLVLATAACC